MSTITVNECPIHYKLKGEGIQFVFIHGDFINACMQDPQFEHFFDPIRVLGYGLRAHGRTQPSAIEMVSMQTFIDDLAGLLDALNIMKPVVCGLSMWRMIAQAFTMTYPGRLRVLILSDTAVSVSLTWTHKLRRYVLITKWLMLLTIQLISAACLTRFIFWMGKITHNEGWIGKNVATRGYIETPIVKVSDDEYLIVSNALYDSRLLSQEVISCPALV